jgi:hypothetical protein
VVNARSSTAVVIRATARAEHGNRGSVWAEATGTGVVPEVLPARGRVLTRNVADKQRTTKAQRLIVFIA